MRTPNGAVVGGDARATWSALRAVGLWVLVELLSVISAAIVLVTLEIPLDSGRAVTVEQVARTADILVLGLLFRRLARSDFNRWGALGYRPLDKRSALTGLLLGAILLASVAVGTQSIDSFLFPEGAARASERLRMLAAAGVPAAMLLLVGNGVLVPLVEELAWRGYIQMTFIRRWGPTVGVIVTALLFAAKHIVVDMSLLRTTTLLFASFALGVIGNRWGTTASTIAHLVMNFIATSWAIVAAHRGWI